MATTKRIPDKHVYIGRALAALIEVSPAPISIAKASEGQGHFRLNDFVDLHVKFATKAAKRAPGDKPGQRTWIFNFRPDVKARVYEDLERDEADHGRAFVVLVCADHGYAMLDWSQCVTLMKLEPDLRKERHHIRVESKRGGFQVKPSKSKPGPSVRADRVPGAVLAALLRPHEG